MFEDIMKPSPIFALILATCLLSGCVGDSVQVPIMRDNPYIGYAKKVIGRGEGTRIKDGPHYEYYSIGRKKSEFHIKNGKFNGIYTKWDERGMITSRVLYKDDKVVRDLLKEHYEEGRQAYRIQQGTAPRGSGVTKVELKPPSGKAVRKYDRTALDVEAVEKRDVPHGTRGSAVRKVGSTHGSAVKKIR